MTRTTFSLLSSVVQAASASPHRSLSCFLLAFLCAACNAQPQALPTLAALPTQTQPPRVLQAWKSESGSLASVSETNLWQIDGRAGDQITLKAVSPSDQVFTLTLFTPAGAVLAQGETLAATLPADSTYFVQVQANQAGAYEIGMGYSDATPVPAATIAQVVGVPTPTPPLAAPGEFIAQIKSPETASNRISAESPLHLYTYMGVQGEVLNLRLQRISGPIDPLLTIYEPDGDMLAMDDNNGGGRSARLWNVPLPADGVYTLQVSAHETFGEYTLTLSQGVEMIPTDVVIQPTPVAEQVLVTPTLGVPVGERLIDHAPALGKIDGPSGFARFLCSAQEGQTLTVGVLPAAGSGLRPALEVFNPDGEQIMAVRSTQTQLEGGTGVVNVPVTLTGPYQLIVTGESDTFGDFVVSCGVGPSYMDQVKGEAVASQQVSDAILKLGVRDVWLVRLGAGDVISAAVSPNSGLLDPILEIVAPDGTVIARDDNGGGDRAAFVRVANIPTSGVYMLKVSDAKGLTKGPYSMIWRYINLAPTATPLPQTVTLMQMEDTVSAGEYRFFVFPGRAGERMRIQVEPLPDSRLDPVAVLLAPDGTDLMTGDDSESSMNPDFVYTLPADGTYTVRVNGYLSFGAFALRVSAIVD